jgi:hypothetical protein
MPILPSSYQPTRLFRQVHLNTIYASKLRKVPGPDYRRERMELPDGDFLDLDWAGEKQERVVLVLHGLEGSTDRPYMRGMLRRFVQGGWQGVGMNFRSCSGEMNRLLRVYHSGETKDLTAVLAHIKGKGGYREIALVGFSLGGNVVLKYLGEQGDQLPPELKRAVAISVPCDLVDSSRELNDRWDNGLYLKRFMRYLNEKLTHKLQQFPGQIQLPEGRMPRNFTEFDDCFTAPVHGYRDATDYWTQASSKPGLANIQIPTLLLSARDDSFLSESCYPFEIAKNHAHLHLEVPAHGGHVGFVSTSADGSYYSEGRAYEFVNQKIKA